MQPTHVPNLSFTQWLVFLCLFLIIGTTGFFIGIQYHSLYPSVAVKRDTLIPTDWKTFSYTNTFSQPKATVSFSYPPSWQVKQLSTGSNNNPAYSISGTEGTVWVQSGASFGGTEASFMKVCPPIEENLTLANGKEYRTCQRIMSDGTETWLLDSGSELFVNMRANNPVFQNQQIILSILSSIRFN